MNKRILSLLSHVPEGIGLIDVGTDHGFLPVELARRGYSGRLFASDINAEPLQAARRNAEKAGFADRIAFLQCDGLAMCRPESVDTIVIAGMGGDLICRILDRAEWTMDERYTMLLQPMTKAEVLRYWLSNNDYGIQYEDLVLDGGKLYQFMLVRFGQGRPLTDAELFTGERNLIKDHPYFPLHLQTQTERLRAQLAGMEHGKSSSEQGKLLLVKGILQEMEEMKRYADSRGDLSLPL